MTCMRPRAPAFERMSAVKTLSCRMTPKSSEAGTPTRCASPSTIPACASGVVRAAGLGRHGALLGRAELGISALEEAGGAPVVARAGRDACREDGIERALDLGGIAREIRETAEQVFARGRKRRLARRVRVAGRLRVGKREIHPERGGGPPRIEVGCGSRNEVRVEGARARGVAETLAGPGGPVGRAAAGRDLAVEGRSARRRGARPRRSYRRRSGRRPRGTPRWLPHRSSGPRSEERREEKARLVRAAGSPREVHSSLEKPAPVVVAERPREESRRARRGARRLRCASPR